MSKHKIAGHVPVYFMPSPATRKMARLQAAEAAAKAKPTASATRKPKLSGKADKPAEPVSFGHLRPAEQPDAAAVADAPSEAEATAAAIIRAGQKRRGEVSAPAPTGAALAIINAARKARGEI